MKAVVQDAGEETPAREGCQPALHRVLRHLLDVNQVVCSLLIKAWVVAQFCNSDVCYIDTGICFIPHGTGTVRLLLVPTAMGVWEDFIKLLRGKLHLIWIQTLWLQTQWK